MSWATTTRGRSPTTGPTRGTTSCRTTCSSRTRPGASVAPVPRLGLVGAVRATGRPLELPQREPGPGGAAGRDSGPNGRSPRLRLDRPHVPTRPTRCQLALLRDERRRSRLRRRRDALSGGPAARQDTRDLEPAAVVRHRPPGSPAAEHRAVRPLPARRRQREPSGSLVDHAVAGGERAPARARLDRTGVGNQDHQRRHARPGLAVYRDLPRLGRLGRVLRPRRAPARRRERLRTARPRARDQPVRATRVHRPPGAELRRVPEVHRGRLPRRRPHRPPNGRSS